MNSAPVPPKGVRIARLFFHAALLMMIVLAIYEASQMGWIRASLFIPDSLNP